MKFYKLVTSDGESRLTVELDEGVLTDLTSIDEDVTGLDNLALAASISRTDIDELAARILDLGVIDTYNLGEIVESSRAGDGYLQLDRPFDPPEVWAAGVTYQTSEMERRRESETPDIYSKVYTAERPELFFKATPERCVGPFESVGFRGDSDWNVPEPELAFVLYKDDIIGYTVGNDMSSRRIEGENPLYLPQAKVFARCCSIGPCFVSASTLLDPYNLNITCVIERDGEEVFSGETNTSLMARTCEDLADWLLRHNVLPNMTAVLTGTAIVPPPEFTLQEGDIVTISIDGIGTLENDVVEV